MNIRILYFALSAAVFCGCSKSTADVPENGVSVVVDVEPAGGFEALTRGPMNGWNNSPVYMAYGESPANSGFLGFERALSGVISSGLTVFQPLLFYPINGEKIYLKGFYPREGITNLSGVNKTIQDNKIRYTITGQEDIMVSNMVSGSGLPGSTIADQRASLDYAHLLTQLSFTTQCTEGFPNAIIKVVEINLCNVSRNAVLDLTLDKDHPDVLTFLDIPSPATKFKVYSDPGGMELTTDVSREGHYTLLKPGEHFMIEVLLSSGDKVYVESVINALDGTDIADGNTRKGYKYRIDLLFSMSGLAPSLSASWNSVQTDIGAEGWW